MIDIQPFHDALCEALGVPMRLSYQDRMRWERFLFDANQSLPEDAPLTPRDVLAVVALRRRENEQDRARWALRYNKVLFDSETFRDQVLETRRKFRPVAPRMQMAVQSQGGITRQVEVPASEQEERRVRDLVREQALAFKRQHGRA